uniref:RNA helicase n=1 Tax=Amphiprion ocellaris TaxID=80972 RepID=A0AAQ6AEL2_AMPOC
MLLRNHPATVNATHEDVRLDNKIVYFSVIFVVTPTLNISLRFGGRSGSEMGDFSSLGLSDWLVKQCKQLGINKPTPVQQNCMPAILEGRDCMGCAKTGSGKTAAFVLPVLQKLSEEPYGIFCLVLTPTRELAYQIAEQFRVLGKPLGLRDCIIVGGMDMVSQALELSNKPHVVVATPGRLADHIRSSNTFSMSKIQFLIMDEADRLLEQGCTDFTKDLEVIMGILPAKRQTLLFSATLTDTLQELKSIAMNKPFFWESTSETRTVEELDQRYILTPEKVKDAYLVHLIQTFTDEHDDWSIIIFTNTCKNCQILTMMLREFNFPTISLHSMMKQKQRFANLSKFKASVYKILIATDVAARGLDIPTVQVVINHNTPGLPKIYIHRVGRTARAGRNGVSITLVTQYDIHLSAFKLLQVLWNFFSSECFFSYKKAKHVHKSTINVKTKVAVMNLKSASAKKMHRTHRSGPLAGHMTVL